MSVVASRPNYLNPGTVFLLAAVWEVVWVSKLVWTIWRAEKSLVSVGIEHRFLGLQPLAQSVY